MDKEIIMYENHINYSEQKNRENKLPTKTGLSHIVVIIKQWIRFYPI